MSSLYNEKWHRHFGVYGICINEKSEILVIMKCGGPYSDKYDLPGGSFKGSESLIMCLKREYMEETGCEISVRKNIGCYDFLVNSSYNGCNYTHHIAAFYLVNIVSNNCRIKRKLFHDNNVEINDSLYAQWIDLNKINSSNSSPLLVKVRQLLMNDNYSNIEEIIY